MTKPPLSEALQRADAADQQSKGGRKLFAAVQPPQSQPDPASEPAPVESDAVTELGANAIAQALNQQGDVDPAVPAPAPTPAPVPTPAVQTRFSAFTQSFAGRLIGEENFLSRQVEEIDKRKGMIVDKYEQDFADLRAKFDEDSKKLLDNREAMLDANAKERDDAMRAQSAVVAALDRLQE